jgi:hypothetical protein
MSEERQLDDSKMQHKAARAASTPAKCNTSQRKQLNFELAKAIQVRESISSQRMQLPGDICDICRLNDSSMQHKSAKAAHRQRKMQHESAKATQFQVSERAAQFQVSKTISSQGTLL